MKNILNNSYGYATIKNLKEFPYDFTANSSNDEQIIYNNLSKNINEIVMTDTRINYDSSDIDNTSINNSQFDHRHHHSHNSKNNHHHNHHRFMNNNHHNNNNNNNNNSSVLAKGAVTTFLMMQTTIAGSNNSGSGSGIIASTATNYSYHPSQILDNFLNLTVTNLSDYITNNNNNNNLTTNSNDIMSLSSSYSNEIIDSNGVSNINSSSLITNSVDSNSNFTSIMTKKDFVFDRTDVKIIFITLYSLVFCCCFFGNLLVILVVTLSRRLRSITNFFLANLAVADFCVGVFCVMQNLTIYLIDSWVFGEFLCRMYQFIHSLSYTASIFILVVICMERYFAIIHPITCKQILTPSRLRLVIFGVWITSAIYSTPKFIFSTTITNLHTNNSVEEKICILDRKMFNSKLLDLINFALLYVTPLLVMTILYSRIAIALWKSSRGLERHIALQNTSTFSPTHSGNNLYRRQSSKYEKRTLGVTESQLNGNMQVSVDSTNEKLIVTTWKKSSFHHRHQHNNHHHHHHGTQIAQHMSHSSNNVLRARRGVIRMLIIVVLTFALCNLPYHARKMWQNWSNTYKGDSNFIALFTPLTFLVTYFNSGVNPLLYAFLSRNFRKGMRELLFCSIKKGKGKSSSIHQRVPLHNHSLPTDSTHIGNQL